MVIILLVAMFLYNISKKESNAFGNVGMRKSSFCKKLFVSTGLYLSSYVLLQIIGISLFGKFYCGKISFEPAWSVHCRGLS